jgi:hypothetical protein
MKRADLFTKVMVATIAVGLWALILRPVFAPREVSAAGEAQAPVSKVLRAERFEVVDSQGNARAFLAVLSDGSPALALGAKDGKIRAMLTLRPDGSPMLNLVDKARKGRAVLTLRPDGSPVLRLLNKEGKAGAMLSVLSDGSPELRLWDKAGRTLWSAP